MRNDTFDALKQQYHTGTITLADSNRLVNELILRSDQVDTPKLREIVDAAGKLAKAVTDLVEQLQPE